MRTKRRVTGSRLLRAAVPVLVAGVAACASFGGARPAWAPLPDAVVFASPAAVSVILREIGDSLEARGLGVAKVAPPEGYLESGWYDLRSRSRVPEPIGDFDQVTKLRFFVDPVGLHTRVIAEAVRRTGWDPSRPPRELEVMLPAEHPGRLLLDSLLAGIPRGTVAPPPTSTRTQER